MEFLVMPYVSKLVRHVHAKARFTILCRIALLHCSTKGFYPCDAATRHGATEQYDVRNIVNLA